MPTVRMSIARPPRAVFHGRGRDPGGYFTRPHDVAAERSAGRLPANRAVAVHEGDRGLRIHSEAHLATLTRTVEAHGPSAISLPLAAEAPSKDDGRGLHG